VVESELQQSTIRFVCNAAEHTLHMEAGKYLDNHILDDFNEFMAARRLRHELFAEGAPYSAEVSVSLTLRRVSCHDAGGTVLQDSTK